MIVFEMAAVWCGLYGPPMVMAGALYVLEAYEASKEASTPDRDDPKHEPKHEPKLSKEASTPDRSKEASNPKP
jgi:hypothetical protein